MSFMFPRLKMLNFLLLLLKRNLYKMSCLYQRTVVYDASTVPGRRRDQQADTGWKHVFINFCKKINRDHFNIWVGVLLGYITTTHNNFFTIECNIKYPFILISVSMFKIIFCERYFLIFGHKLICIAADFNPW